MSWTIEHLIEVAKIVHKAEGRVPAFQKVFCPYFWDLPNHPENSTKTAYGIPILLAWMSENVPIWYTEKGTGTLID